MYEGGMSSDRPKRDSMSLEETTISNMWEIAALVELLERKGLCTKQDLFDIITELRKQNPRAKIPETAFPEPYLFTETENRIIDDILGLLNKNGLTSHELLSETEAREAHRGLWIDPHPVPPWEWRKRGKLVP